MNFVDSVDSTDGRCSVFTLWIIVCTKDDSFELDSLCTGVLLRVHAIVFMTLSSAGQFGASPQLVGSVHKPLCYHTLFCCIGVEFCSCEALPSHGQTLTRAALAVSMH